MGVSAAFVMRGIEGHGTTLLMLSLRPNKARVIRLSIITLALSPFILLAQSQAPTTRPSTTQADSRPADTQALDTQPDTQPLDTQPVETQPLAIRLNFKDASLDAVLQYLSDVAGFVVIRDVPVDGRVTLLSLQPVSPEQAVTLLNTILRANGLAAMQNGRTLRIVREDRARRHADTPVHFGADPSSIDATDELITQVIPIKNVDAVKLQADLKPIIGPDADVASNAGSNAIVMTDTSANVKRVVEIINTLDKGESSQSELKVIQLKNASASSAVKLVLSIFHTEEPRIRGGDPNQIRAFLEAQRQGKALGGGMDKALNGGHITAAADDRTNTVIVAGPTDTVKLIEGMLHDLDNNDSQVSQIKTFHLKSANAYSVSRVILSMFGEEEQGQTHLNDQSGVRTHVTASVEERTNTLIITAPAGTLAIIENIIHDLDTNPGVSPNIHSYHLKFADATSIDKVLSSVFNDVTERRRGQQPERINVTAEGRTNTLIVNGSPEALQIVDKLVSELDVSPNAGADVKFFHLKHADSVSAAKTIQAFFKPPDNTKSTDPSKYEPVNATADDRTNTVMVTAPPEAMSVVEQIVQELEADPSTVYQYRSYPLTFADASATAKQLTTMFTPDPQAVQDKNKPLPKDALHAHVICTFDDRTNTVMVTAPEDTLKIIDGMVKMLDANPASADDLQVFQLQYADADSAATLIDSIFDPDANTNTSSKSRSSSSNDPNRRPSKVHASADDRTNSLVVTAPGDLLKVVGKIIHQLDSNPSSKETFFIYRLRNAQSQNLELVLNEMFGNYQMPGSTGAFNRSGTNATASSQSQGSMSRTLSSSNGFRQPTMGGAFGSTTAAPFSAGRSSSRTPNSLSSSMMHVVTDLTGEVSVVADPDTNSLLVTTATKYQQQVKHIIEELDKPVPQVLIKVLIAEVTHEDAGDWGVDFSILNQRPSGKGLTVGQSMGNTSAYANNGGLAVSLLEGNVQATLHALATEGKLDVLSRPYILASDNQQASISVGQQVPIVTNVQVTDTGQLITTPTYQPVGIILNVTPHINPEGLVILDVAPEISQLTSSNIQIAPGVQSPVFDQRTAQSRVGIPDGKTIVIGGLMEDRKNTTINKVPILGDIPLIGELFRRTQTDKTKTELLIFLTPHVAQQPDLLDPMSKQEIEHTKLTPNAVSPGTFQDHLSGMQRGSVPQTRPSDQPPTVEYTPLDEPTTQPDTQDSEPIHIPAR